MADGTEHPLQQEFLAHEVLDRTAVVTATWDAFVADHQFVQGRDDLRQAADKISEAMHDFYQLMGGIHLTEAAEQDR